jgi:dsRNA-specific ribonuclease
MTANHIGALQEFCQKVRINNPIYTFEELNGEHHAYCKVDVHGQELQGHGVNAKKKLAQQIAAESIFKSLPAASKRSPDYNHHDSSNIYSSPPQMSLSRASTPHVSTSNVPSNLSPTFRSQSNTPYDSHPSNDHPATDVKSLSRSFASLSTSHYSDRSSSPTSSLSHISESPYASRITPNSPFTQFIPGKSYLTFLRCLVSRFNLPASAIQTEITHTNDVYSVHIRVVGSNNNDLVCEGKADEPTKRGAVQRAAYNALTDLLDFDT